MPKLKGKKYPYTKKGKAAYKKAKKTTKKKRKSAQQRGIDRGNITTG